jgi:hypothetical protein
MNAVDLTTYLSQKITAIRDMLEKSFLMLRIFVEKIIIRIVFNGQLMKLQR